MHKILIGLSYATIAQAMKTVTSYGFAERLRIVPLRNGRGYKNDGNNYQCAPLNKHNRG